jgi:hypothetical protein
MSIYNRKSIIEKAIISIKITFSRVYLHIQAYYNMFLILDSNNFLTIMFQKRFSPRFFAAILNNEITRCIYFVRKILHSKGLWGK